MRVVGFGYRPRHRASYLYACCWFWLPSSASCLLPLCVLLVLATVLGIVPPTSMLVVGFGYRPRHRASYLYTCCWFWLPSSASCLLPLYLLLVLATVLGIV